MKTLCVASVSRSRLAFMALASLGLSVAASSVHAADFYLTTADGGFADAGGWGQAPSAGNNYFSNTRRVVTAISTPVVFAGDRLTLNGGILEIRTGNSSVTVNDLRIQNGTVRNFQAGTPNLIGNIELTGFGRMASSTGSAMRSTGFFYGTGELRIDGGVFTIQNTNTYSGGTSILTNAFQSQLDVQRDGALGTGNVTVNAGSVLKLNLGTTHNYIADTASLIFAGGLTGTSVNLSFAGTDIIGGLSFDGGTTWAASGTYGAVGSGATFQNAAFTGTGLLQVSPIPEPSTAALLMSVCVLAAVTCKRRRISPVS